MPCVHRAERKSESDHRSLEKPEIFTTNGGVVDIYACAFYSFVVMMFFLYVRTINTKYRDSESIRARCEIYNILVLNVDGRCWHVGLMMPLEFGANRGKGRTFWLGVFRVAFLEAGGMWTVDDDACACCCCCLM